jgi:hypothetical protein
MNLTNKQLDLLGKRILVRTSAINVTAKIRVLVETPASILFLREEGSKPPRTWTFDPEKLVIATDADNVGEANPADFVYKGKLVDF